MYQVNGQELKYGLWEDGKRVEWFDIQTAQKIEAGILDFRSFFKKNSVANISDTSSGLGPFANNDMKGDFGCTF